MNILFSYRYRDGANYKQQKKIIFKNSLNRKVEAIEFLIKRKLIDELWFVADDWQIPNQFFTAHDWDEEIDHTWHEFDYVKETAEEVTEKNTVEDLLQLIEETKLPW